MKEHYQKALATMYDINMLELERFRMKAPVTQEEMSEKYGQEVMQRFGNVHEAYLKQGKTREKYMERLKLEFKEAKSIETQDLEALDGYFEHKRWFKQKSKALFRDWERDKKDLRDKTITLIE